MSIGRIVWEEDVISNLTSHPNSYGFYFRFLFRFPYRFFYLFSIPILTFNHTKNTNYYGWCAIYFSTTLHTSRTYIHTRTIRQNDANAHRHSVEQFGIIFFRFCLVINSVSWCFNLRSPIYQMVLPTTMDSGEWEWESVDENCTYEI